MNLYAVRLKGTAAKEYHRLPPDVQRRVVEALVGLESNPRPQGARLLSGELQGLYRIRIGEYRIVYQVDDVERVVSVVRIRPRGRAYR